MAKMNSRHTQDDGAAAVDAPRQPAHLLIAANEDESYFSSLNEIAHLAITVE